MSRRSISCLIAGVLASGLLALAPQAHARDSAKFKVQSISGTSTVTRDAVYDPSPYGSCSLSQAERVSFHSTKRPTAYAFTSKSHGSARVAWSEKPTYTGNLAVVEVPGEVTVSRSASYEQTNYVDPDTGEVQLGCFRELLPVDCTLERTFKATLNIGGTSGVEESTYIELSMSSRDLDGLDASCPVEATLAGGDDPGLFSRSALFEQRQKRVSDSDRVEAPIFDNPTDDMTESGTVVDEIAAELKRRKRPR